MLSPNAKKRKQAPAVAKPVKIQDTEAMLLAVPAPVFEGKEKPNFDKLAAYQLKLCAVLGRAVTKLETKVASISADINTVSWGMYCIDLFL